MEVEGWPGRVRYYLSSSYSHFNFTSYILPLTRMSPPCRYTESFNHLCEESTWQGFPTCFGRVHHNAVQSSVEAEITEGDRLGADLFNAEAYGSVKPLAVMQRELRLGATTCELRGGKKPVI